jgi:hypothetical protein
MTTKADFNAEEWSRVVEGPALAGLLVVSADRGGTIRESVAMAKTYTELREQYAGTELMEAVLTSRPEVDPGAYKSKEDLQAGGRQRLTEDVALVEQKGTSEELDAYRRFILDVARRAAEAHKEGGFLGIGGTKVSEAEWSALEDIAAAIGAEPPLRPTG